MALQHLYPELGVDLGEKAYGSDCRLSVEGEGINWPVIKATLFDEFVVAHTVGWWAKVCGDPLQSSVAPNFSANVHLGMERSPLTFAIAEMGDHLAGTDHSGLCAAVGAVYWV